MAMRQRRAAGANDAPASVRYCVSFVDPTGGWVEVAALVAAEGASALELFLPEWTPGSYRRRDHAARLEALRAWGGDWRELRVDRAAANHWHVDTAGCRAVRVTYRAQAAGVEAAGGIVDCDLALLDGAATFVGVAGREARPHGLDVVRPAAWRTVVTSLRSGAGAAYVAADYDELVDSLLYLGNPAVSRFRIDGVDLQLVTQGDNAEWDRGGALSGLRALSATILAFWGGAPFDRYTFLTVFGDRVGGLEHRASSVILTRRPPPGGGGLLDWLGMAAHELFHAWNGCHLWPPSRFAVREHGVPRSRDLWVTEGVTAYYDRLLLARAGLSTPRALLADLSSWIGHLRQSPGRLVRTLEEAALDVWEEMPPRERARRTVSVYVKGALLAWSIDAALRRETGGRVRLDDVMREAWRRYGGRAESDARQLEELVVEHGGARLRPLLERGVRTTDELDLAGALDWFGLELRPAAAERPRLAVCRHPSAEQRRHLVEWLAGPSGLRPHPQ